MSLFLLMRPRPLHGHLRVFPLSDYCEVSR